MSSEHPPIPIAQLTGPLLLGHLFNWALFGCLSVQAFIYYLAFPKDKFFPTKALAYGIYLFEVAQIVLTTYDAFRNFASDWGNQPQLDFIGAFWFSIPIMGAIVSCTSQIFYAWRVWILSHRQRFPVIPLFIIALSLTQGIAAVYDGHLAFKLGKFSLLGEYTMPVTPIWLGGTAACDVVIAVAMTYYLWRSRGIMLETNAIIIKLILLSVETGTFCAFVAVVELAMFLAWPHNNFHIAPSLALSKLYSNSLFAVLNSRIRISGGRTGENREHDPTLSFSMDTDSSGLSHGAAPGQLSWHVASNSHIQFASMGDADTQHQHHATSIALIPRRRGDVRASAEISPLSEEGGDSKPTLFRQRTPDPHTHFNV